MKASKLFRYSLLVVVNIAILGCGSGATLNDDTNHENLNTNKPTPERVDVQPKSGIHINEFMTSNLNTIMDSDYYAFSDWIEIYNNSNSSVDIGGYFLSDDKNNPTKWSFPPNTVIGANSYLLVWADGKDKKRKEIHTNFKLSSKKENIIFSDRNGNIIDNISYKDQEADISAVSYDGGIAYMLPSPKSINNVAYSSNKVTPKPTFSLSGGFYTASQRVSMDSDGATIYYTTDGSIPSTSSTIYTNPIEIDKTTVIKAIAFKDGLFPSKYTAHTYFINEDSTIPVISLSVDPKYLYDDMIGIYVDGDNGKVLKGCGDNSPHNFAQKWKRPANIEYFSTYKSEFFDIGADLSISGECSRLYKKKSFNIKLDSKYNAKEISKSFYIEKPNIKNIKDFKIRAGNRGYEIGDIFGAALVKEAGLNIDYQAHQVSRVFVNGEYWGVYNLREKKSKDFIKENYPDIKKVDIIKNGKIVKEGSIDEYQKLNNTHNPSQLAQMIDVDSFIDYISFMIFSGNYDWSYSNTRAWRERKDGAKWRWMVDDVDEAFDGYYLYADLFFSADDGILNSYHELYDIFTTLMSDPSIKQRFKNRFYSLLQNEFSPARLKPIADRLFAERYPYMPNYEPKEKWFKSYFVHDYNSYKQRVYEFIDKRADIVKAQLDRF